MITAQEALNFQPQKAGMNGYRAVEVDQFVESVAQTLDFQEKKIRDLQNKVNELKKDETIIQTTLVNAQKLAMQLTDDAKEKARQITEEAEAKASAGLNEAQESARGLLNEAKANAQRLSDETAASIRELDKSAREKAANIINDAYAEAKRVKEISQAETDHQNKILDALKSEVAKFRSDVLNMYKEQVTLIRDLPDMMPENPVFVADEIKKSEQEQFEAQQEQPADVAGSDLMKIMSDMKANEEQAAAAVNEVASLTADDSSEESAQNTFEQTTLIFGNHSDSTESDTSLTSEDDDDIPVIPVTKRDGGFSVIIDDDDDEN